MTVLKYIVPALGLATFIHAQDAVDSNQDFPIETTITPVIEETEAPGIVEVESPAPVHTAKKSKAKAKQQEPQQVYNSNELDYVPVSKSIMLLSLHEDDSADPPDSRDNDNTPKKEEAQTSGGLFGFLADDSTADASGENGSRKKRAFKLGLHVGLGYLTAKSSIIRRYYEDGNFDDAKLALESEFGISVALKSIAANIFVSSGFYCSFSWMNFHGSFDHYGDYYGYYSEHDIFNRYSVSASVPITVGYQFMNMINIEAGTQLSLAVLELDDSKVEGDDTWIPNEFSAGFVIGASAVLGQKHEVGLKVKIKSNETLYALTYNYWLF